MQRKLSSFAVCAGFLFMCMLFVYPKNNRVPSQHKPDPNTAINEGLVKHYYYSSLIKKPATSVRTYQLTICADPNAIPGEKKCKSRRFAWSFKLQNNKVTYIEIPVGYNRRRHLSRGIYKYLTTLVSISFILP
jgi:hypothetical protein